MGNTVRTQLRERAQRNCARLTPSIVRTLLVDKTPLVKAPAAELPGNYPGWSPLGTGRHMRHDRGDQSFKSSSTTATCYADGAYPRGTRSRFRTPSRGRSQRKCRVNSTETGVPPWRNRKPATETADSVSLSARQRAAADLLLKHRSADAPASRAATTHCRGTPCAPRKRCVPPGRRCHHPTIRATPTRHLTASLTPTRSGLRPERGIRGSGNAGRAGQIAVAINHRQQIVQKLWNYHLSDFDFREVSNSWELDGAPDTRIR